VLKLAPAGADNRLIPETSTHLRVSPAARPAQRLHVCTRCASELVQPTDWEEAGEDRWQLRLECPNCGWSRRGTFSSVQLTALEDQLDGGFDVLLQDLKRLTTANMTDEIERFAAALATGLVLPEDF
jgi:DNA-directed RNA polymerase subunit RPC12/RpoP